MEDPITLVISALVALVVLYFVIYLSVLAALREHSVWKLAGGAEKKLEQRIDQRTAPSTRKPTE